MSVNDVVQMGLCSACGACAGICPVDAIAMEYNEAGFLYAQIDYEKCINCEKCIKICPGKKVDNISNDNFNEYVLGNVLKGYIGYATDKSIRENGQSGGIVSGLLCFLLQTKKIQGAIVNTFDEKENRPVVKYVETCEEIVKSQGSYYCQTDVVREYIRHSDKRVATVLLGCQANAISMLEKENSIKDNESIKIGLFCGGQFSKHIISDLTRLANVSPEEKVMNLRFKDKREGGVPGDVKIVTDKQSYVLSRYERIKLFELWKCHKCTECMDFYNQQCDIVCGDPWGINQSEMIQKGATVVLVRTKKGQELIDDAIKSGVIYVEEISHQLIIDGQGMLATIRNTGQNGEKYSHNLYFSTGKTMQKVLQSKKRKIKKNENIMKVKNVVKKLIRRKV